MSDLSNKKALVTGGSRGIGKAIAAKLVASGAEVIISGTNAESLAKVADDLGCKYAVANLSSLDEVEKLAEEVGAVDILVNNAGITKDGLFLRQSDEQWADVLQVNLTAPVKLTRLLVKGMLKNRWGRIINTSSVVAHMGNTGQTNYVASKAAITGFTKALAIEIARKNITVNCVAPGFIKTAMTEELTDKARDEMLSNIPMKRFGEVEDVANAVAFLASDEASYITGTTLHINGGMY